MTSFVNIFGESDEEDPFYNNDDENDSSNLKKT
jgi:hypothetical protein